MTRSVTWVVLMIAGAALGQVPASGPATTSAPATSPADTQAAATTTATSRDVAVAPSSLSLTMPSTQPTTTLSAATTGPTTSAFALTTAPTTGATQPGYATTNTGGSSYYSRSSRYGSYAPSYRPPIPQYTGPNLKPRPISSDYYVLLRRSIFIRGSQRVFDPGDGYGNGLSRGYPTTSGPTTDSSSTQPMTPIWSPENVMVFNGASNANGQMVAFIENTSLNSIARFQVGDSVATGKITAITLDQLDYSVNGRVTHVLIGQNLFGVDTQVLTTQAVVGNSGAATSGPAGGADSVLERLRLRRLKELGGQ